MKEVKITELQEIVNSIFRHMTDELKIDSVSPESDYYWDISPEAAFKLVNDPDVQSGQLYDDLDFLTPILEDKSQAVSLMFVHVAPLLKYLAYKVGK